MNLQRKAKDYLYAALPDDGSIRMLILDPGRHGDLLRGTLEVVDCNSASSYESLSYVWGAPEWIHEILIREGDNGGRIKLTHSLYGALTQLRLPDRARRIWVDQICINQSDQQERSQQVRFMNRIYQQASHVLVWLGQDQDKIAQSAFDLVHELDKMFQDETESGKSHTDLQKGLEKVPEEKWAPLNHLTDLPWFTRGWVIQELGTKAPATLVWGASDTDWLVLYNVCMKLNNYRELRYKLSIKTAYLRYIFQRFVEQDLNNDHANRVNFLYELHRARHLKFSDERDRVFAWLGHYSLRWDNTELGALKAEYTKGIAEIYIDVARGALKGSQEMNDGSALIALAAVQHTKLPSSEKTSTPIKQDGVQDTLPSWVPDWRTYQNHMLSEPINPHRAHGTSVPKLSFGQDLSSLIIHGAEVDTIDVCSRPLVSKEFNIKHAISGSETAIEYIWHNICQKGRFNLADKYVNGEESFFACMQTLGNGCVMMARWEENPYHETPPSRWLEKELMYLMEALGESDAIAPDIGDLAKEAKSEHKGEPWTRAVNGAAKNRIFARTKKGYYVLGPKVMEPGDIICVLFGGKQPFCLRHFGNGYRLVGECYVHGLMNGEVLDMMDRQELTELAFEIV